METIIKQHTKADTKESKLTTCTRDKIIKKWIQKLYACQIKEPLWLVEGCDVTVRQALARRCNESRRCPRNVHEASAPAVVEESKALAARMSIRYHTVTKLEGIWPKSKHKRRSAQPHTQKERIRNGCRMPTDTHQTARGKQNYRIQTEFKRDA